MEDNKMTMEELAAQIEEQNKTISDLEAERNSLKEENEKHLEARRKIEEELRRTKELNFTLSRQVSRSQKSAEEILAEMF